MGSNATSLKAAQWKRGWSLLSKWAVKRTTSRVSMTFTGSPRSPGIPGIPRGPTVAGPIGPLSPWCTGKTTLQHVCSRQMYKTVQQVKDKHTTARPTASVHIVPGQVVFAGRVPTKTRKEEKSFLSFVFLYRIPFIYCVSSHYKQNICSGK